MEAATNVEDVQLGGRADLRARRALGHPGGLRPLDDANRAIIESLQRDGRRAYAQIAAEIGLSEAAVRRRVQQLRTSGVIQIVAVTDPLQLGFHRQALIGISVEGDVRAVAAKIVPLPEVDYVVMCAGSFDLLVEVVCEDDEQSAAPLERLDPLDPGRPFDRDLHVSEVGQADLHLGDQMTDTGPDVNAGGATLSERARRHLWMHFTRLGSYDEKHEVPIMVRGEGAYVWDQHGKRYLDGLAGLFTSQIGHGRTELGEAAAKQASELAYFPLWTYAHPRAVELAERIATLTPGDLNRVFFTSGGSEAVESAWKLARQYFRLIGQPNRTKVISRDIAYHGTTMGALSITGIPALKTPFEPLVPGHGQGAQHQLLPGARARRRPRGLRPLGRRRDRAGHRARGSRHRRGRLPRAGAERRRLFPAAARLLRAGPADLRSPRGAARLRRGDLRLRPPGRVVRRRTATATSPTSSPSPRD